MTHPLSEAGTSVEVKLADWEDPQVRQVYEMLCDDFQPPSGEHWEGFLARRIVAALIQPTPAETEGGHRAARWLGDYIAELQKTPNRFADDIWELQQVQAYLEALRAKETVSHG